MSNGILAEETLTNLTDVGTNVPSKGRRSCGRKIEALIYKSKGYVKDTVLDAASPFSHFIPWITFHIFDLWVLLSAVSQIR